MLDDKAVQDFYKNQREELEELLDVNPTHVTPVVTQKDALQGFIVRYFVRPVNDVSMIVEVDKNQYENLKSNVRFICVMIEWRIVGKKETKMFPTGANIYGVGDLNRIEVANADLTFGGLTKYVNNYLEFWFSE